MAFFKLLSADKRREIEGKPLLFDPNGRYARANSHRHALTQARLRYPDIDWTPEAIETVEAMIQAGQSKQMRTRVRRKPRVGELHRIVWANMPVYVVYNSLEGLVKTFLTEEMVSRDWG